MIIIEGNKLIAEFMGWKYLPETAGHGIEDNSWKDKRGNNHYELLFHTTWNELMPVIEKIGEHTPVDIHIGAGIKISNRYGTSVDPFSGKDTFIGSTWDFCVKFIQWYNEKNR
jgi:hypothetical protein